MQKKKGIERGDMIEMIFLDFLGATSFVFLFDGGYMEAATPCISHRPTGWCISGPRVDGLAHGEGRKESNRRKKLWMDRWWRTQKKT